MWLQSFVFSLGISVIIYINSLFYHCFILCYSRVWFFSKPKYSNRFLQKM